MANGMGRPSRRRPVNRGGGIGSRATARVNSQNKLGKRASMNASLSRLGRSAIGNASHPIGGQARGRSRAEEAYRRGTMRRVGKSATNTAKQLGNTWVSNMNHVRNATNTFGYKEGSLGGRARAKTSAGRKGYRGYYIGE